MSKTFERVSFFVKKQIETQKRGARVTNMQLSALIECELAYYCEMLNEAFEAKMAALS